MNPSQRKTKKVRIRKRKGKENTPEEGNIRGPQSCSKGAHYLYEGGRQIKGN